jgi:hypothetical protein
MAKPCDESERDRASEELAEYLYRDQWHLDPPPGEDGPSKWRDLPEFDLNFFRSSVEAMLSRTALVLAAVSRP